MDDNKKDISQIKKYLNGELDARAMHKLERDAQDDPFLTDALDGFEQSTGTDMFNFDDLDQRLADRIGESKVRKMFPWKYYAAAASVLLFFTIGYLMWPKPEVAKQQVADLVQPQAAQPDHTTAPVDTAPASAVRPALALKKVPVMPHLKPAEHVLQQTDTNSYAANQNQLRDVDSAKHLSQLSAKLNGLNAIAKNQLPTRVGGQPQTNQTYGNGGAPARYFGSSKTDSVTLREIVIPGVAKPNAIAAKTAAEPQTLDNKVIGAEVKTPKKGNNAMLSQLGLPLNTNLPTPTKKDIQADARLSEPVKTSSSAGNVASRAGSDKADESGKTENNAATAGYEKAKPDNITQAHPKMGWEAYNKYIKAKAVGGTGTVRLLFMVDAKGQLMDLKVVKSVDKATDEKAIDLVKNGPAWAPDVSGKTKTIQLKVAFSKE